MSKVKYLNITLISQIIHYHLFYFLFPTSLLLVLGKQDRTMEVDTIISDASGSESAEQNSKLITPANTIEGKSIEEFTKVSVSAKEINIYHR